MKTPELLRRRDIIALMERKGYPNATAVVERLIATGALPRKTLPIPGTRGWYAKTDVLRVLGLNTQDS